MVQEEPAYGSGETAQDIERQTSRTLPVLWCTLQHARDGSSTLPGRTGMEILAESTQQQESFELGEIPDIAG